MTQWHQAAEAATELGSDIEPVLEDCGLEDMGFVILAAAALALVAAIALAVVMLP